MSEPERSECNAISGYGDVEISPKEWGSFLDSFSEQHEGWLMSISLLPEIQTSAKANNYRLERISLDVGNATGGIRISVLRDDGNHLLYHVASPSRVILKRDSIGAHEGLDIASADGSVTSLRFRAAALPESLDGVLTDLDGTQAKRGS